MNKIRISPNGNLNGSFNGNGNGDHGGGGGDDDHGWHGGPQPDDDRGYTVHWENLMSLRYWLGSVFGGFMFVLAVSILASLVGWTLPDWLVQTIFIAFVVSALIGGLIGRRYWCPHCRGMVRAGATACQHCGRGFTV